ncbi:MAG TPA: PQQ-binding-like beta-propeller repeat protein [Bryobacteraceae bacterium]|nr:PQQ-binding-like beta-propeller repeat protein [Bryobacteraceae bacterium]
MLRSRLALWLGVFLFPPIGIVLLWMRGNLGVFRRLAGTLGIFIVAIFELFYLYGMRIVWDGNFRPYAVTFESPKRHDAQVEQSRARQRAEAPALAASVAAMIEPVRAPVVAPATPRPAAYWTDFRGPNRDGVYAETDIETAWAATGLPRLWRQPIGAGYASFTVGDGRAYTIEQRRDREAVTAYDVETGREVWAFTYSAAFDEVLGGPGPRATPVYHDGLIYSLGALGDLYCLSARTGKPKWSKNILSDNGANNVHWAMAGSPLIVDDNVIVTPGGMGGKSIVAYKRLTGEPVWRSLNDRAGYTSPLVGTLAARRQIVWISAERAVGLTTEDGKLLWDFPFPAQMDMNCSQPVIVDDSHVFLSSAPGPGAALLEITKSGDTYSARAVWQNNRMKNKFNSSVLYQGYIYGFDEAILACMDAKTGELKWKGGRYGYGQLLLAGGYLVITTEQGDLVLVRATPESHQELARFSAIEGRTWNIPAIDHGLLLVRNASEMACFRLGKSL